MKKILLTLSLGIAAGSCKGKDSKSNNTEAETVQNEEGDSNDNTGDPGQGGTQNEGYQPTAGDQVNFVTRTREWTSAQEPVTWDSETNSSQTVVGLFEEGSPCKYRQLNSQNNLYYDLGCEKLSCEEAAAQDKDPGCTEEDAPPITIADLGEVSGKKVSCKTQVEVPNVVNGAISGTKFVASYIETTIYQSEAILNEAQIAKTEYVSCSTDMLPNESLENLDPCNPGGSRITNNSRTINEFVSQTKGSGDTIIIKDSSAFVSSGFVENMSEDGEFRYEVPVCEQNPQGSVIDLRLKKISCSGSDINAHNLRFRFGSRAGEQKSLLADFEAGLAVYRVDHTQGNRIPTCTVDFSTNEADHKLIGSIDCGRANFFDPNPASAANSVMISSASFTCSPKPDFDFASFNTPPVIVAD